MPARRLRWQLRAFGHQVRELPGNRPVYLIIMPIPRRNKTDRVAPANRRVTHRIRRHQIQAPQHFLLADLHMTFQTIVIVVNPERSLRLRKPRLLAHGWRLRLGSLTRQIVIQRIAQGPVPVGGRGRMIPVQVLNVDPELVADTVSASHECLGGGFVPASQFTGHDHVISNRFTAGILPKL